MTRLLALRALGLGDLLTALPALRGARRAWPRQELVLAAPEQLGSWLGSLGVVDEVLPASGLGPLAWTGPGPDIALNLHGCGPQSHRLLQALRPGRLVAFANGEAGHPDAPAWRADEHEVDRWVRLMRCEGAQCDLEDLRLSASGARARHVVVHPGAASPSRRWPPSRWAGVAAKLAASGRPVIVTGLPAEADLCAGVAGGHPGIENRCGALPVAQLAEVVGTAALVLCGDTGVAHLATAYRTRSVVLFGPVSPQLWGPRIDRDRHQVLWEPRPGDPPGDPHGAELDPRLERVSPEQVLDAAARLLSGPLAGPFSPSASGQEVR